MKDDLMWMPCRQSVDGEPERIGILDANLSAKRFTCCSIILWPRGADLIVIDIA